MAGFLLLLMPMDSSLPSRLLLLLLLLPAQGFEDCEAATADL